MKGAAALLKVCIAVLTADKHRSVAKTAVLTTDKKILILRRFVYI